MKSLARRDFIRTIATATAAGTILPAKVSAKKQKTAVFAVHGEDVKKMVTAGIGKMGGWSKFVKKGNKVTVKPNAAWESRPEQGGNTDPVLVGQVVRACINAGAREVVVPENIISSSRRAFSMSGIEPAVQQAGGRIYKANKDEHYRAVQLPKARVLRNCDVVVDVLDTDCLINIPVAKNHSSAVLTLSMKNWMGSVKDRRTWHRMDLDQCIADFSTLVRPSLIIVDATRIMLTGGPRGPGTLARPNQLVFGTDPVAVDAYAATLFEKQPFEVPHIKLAHEMGIGCGDLTKVSVEHIRL